MVADLYVCFLRHRLCGALDLHAYPGRGVPGPERDVHLSAECPVLHGAGARHVHRLLLLQAHRGAGCAADPRAAALLPARVRADHAGDRRAGAGHAAGAARAGKGERRRHRAFLYLLSDRAAQHGVLLSAGLQDLLSDSLPGKLPHHPDLHRFLGADVAGADPDPAVYQELPAVPDRHLPDEPFGTAVHQLDAEQMVPDPAAKNRQKACAGNAARHPDECGGGDPQ